jgi:histone H3/H4
MSDLIISKSGTKAAAKGVHIAGDFYKALDKEVRAVIARAVARAKGNGRKTVRPTDL